MTDADSTPNAYQESLSVSNQRKIPGHTITRTRQHLSLWCWPMGTMGPIPPADRGQETVSLDTQLFDPAVNGKLPLKMVAGQTGEDLARPIKETS